MILITLTGGTAGLSLVQAGGRRAGGGRQILPVLVVVTQSQLDEVKVGIDLYELC